MPFLRGVTSCSISPGEILLPRTEIVVELSEALDPRHARGAIQVTGERGRLELEDGGRRLRWRPSMEMEGGPHRLVFGALRAPRGRPIGGEGEIRFFVAKSKSPVPSDVAVESMIRVRVTRYGTNRLSIYRSSRGSYVELIKGRKRATGEPVPLAFDQRGQAVDFDSMRRQIWQNKLRRFGKMDARLHERLRRTPRGARVPVAIWLKGDDLSFEQLTELKSSTGASASRILHRAAERTRRRVDQLIDRLRPMGGADFAPYRGAPIVRASMNRTEIGRVQTLPEVASIFLRRDDGVDNLGNSISIANSDDVHNNGVEGDGVRVAVWERGPDVTTNLDIEDQYDASGSTSEHSRMTHAIIKNTQSGGPHGHAPSCDLYSANSYDLDALEWAVEDANCTVISQSFHRSEEETSGSLSFDDIYKDWLILHWPYPTILQASGNDGDPDVEFVNHKGYNSLAVGNHIDDASVMWGTSVFNNPTSDHGDRELPEICANGRSVSAVGSGGTGTSFSAPAVAGATALIQSKDTTLKSWPEGCRAILLASADRNVSGQLWWEDVVDSQDGSDGSGALNSLEAYRITKNRQYSSSSGSRRGWDVGTIKSSDFDGDGLSTFSYKVKVPSLNSGFIMGPRHVKVALAWNSKVTTLDELFPSWLPVPEVPISSELTLDLDLKVFDSDGNQVGYSGSYDNSYEIAEFDGEYGKTYTIRVRRWSGSDNSWFGVAWNVTGDSLYLNRGPDRDIHHIIDHLRRVDDDNG